MALNKRYMITDKRFKKYCFDAVFLSMRRRGLLNIDYFINLFDRAENITDAEFTSMWKAIGLETWCQLFL